MNVTNNLDNLISTIVSSPDDVTFLKSIILPALQSFPQNVLGQTNTSSGDDPLDMLMADVSRYTLPLLFILPARALHQLNNTLENPAQILMIQKLYTHISEFTKFCNPEHVRLAPAQLTVFGNSICRFGIALNKPVAAIKPLVMATLRCSPSPNHLTSLHPMLMKQCLLAKTYHAAIPVLQNAISEIEPELTDIKVQDLLTYMYYSGMICTGLKMFKKAQEMFMLAISAPALVCSQIQIESYKKYILVSLLADGKVPELPKQTAPIVQRIIKATCQTYIDVQSAYESYNPGRLISQITKSADVLQLDNNYGLARQLPKSIYEIMTSSLTHTYLTLSVSDLGNLVGLSTNGVEGKVERMEMLLLKMIYEEKINASVSHEKNYMVQFFDSDDNFDDDKTRENLSRALTKLSNVNTYVQRRDRMIALSAEFLSKTAQKYDRSSARELDEMQMDYIG